MNARWHPEHKMPPRATLGERIRWHVEHAQQCACRPIPPKLIEEISRKKEQALRT